MEYKDYLLWAISGSGGGSSATKYTVTYDGDEGGLYLPGEYFSLADTGEYYPESIILFSTGELYLNSIDGETTGIDYYSGVHTLGTGLYFIGMPS